MCPTSPQSIVLGAPCGGWGLGRASWPPGPAALIGLSLEQKLSGSHKALVEMQDVVAELLTTVPREYPATKVRGGRRASDPTRCRPWHPAACLLPRSPSSLPSISLRVFGGFLKIVLLYFKSHINSLY